MIQGRSNGNPTLEDVARLAGVSTATVSRCMNRPATVRVEKRIRIQDAIDRLGYVRHGAARALASRRTRMVGAVFPSLDSALFGGALEAFQAELTKAGYTVVVASSGYDAEQEAHHIRNLLESGIDALMLIGAERPRSIVKLIEATRIPFVQAWVSEAANGHACIGFDNRGAAAHLTEYLLMLGHRRFGVISGILAGNDRSTARLAGIRDALGSFGLDLGPEAVVERPFGADSGREAMNIIMAQDPPPTAVICGSEPFAYGAVFGARSLGLRIPEDVSIAGFDDMWLASHLDPPLTTVRTPRMEMGREAAHYLLAKLRGRAVAHPRPLETRLVVRRSTAPPSP